MFSKKICVLLMLFSFINGETYADFASYSESVAFKVKYKNFTVIHYHDFTSRRKDQLHNIFHFGKDAIFEDSLNTYSYIIAIDNKTKDTLFKRPSPALKEIKILNNGTYIVGMSNVKLHNPYQLVIWDNKGNVLFKKDFTQIKYKLTDNELRTFISKFPNHFLSTVTVHNVDKLNDYWIVDPLYGLYDEENVNYRNFITKSPSVDIEVNGISESVTNYIYWYSLNKPDVEIEEENGKIKSIFTYYDGEQENEIGKYKNQIFVKENNFDFQYFVNQNYIQSKDTSAFRNAENLKTNKPKGEIRYPYSQFGNLFDYYSDLKTFLNNNQLQFIDSSNNFQFCKVKSFNLIVRFGDSGWEKYEILSDTIPDKILNSIAKLPDVWRVDFSEVEVVFTKDGKEVIRTPIDIDYRILND